MSSKVTLSTVVHRMCWISQLLAGIAIILSPSLLFDKLGQGNGVKMAVVLDPSRETKIGAGQMNTVATVGDCADEDGGVAVRKMAHTTFLLESGILIEEELVLSIPVS